MNNTNVCIAFLGNISFDTRTLNLYKSFKSKNFNVEVISFDWRNGQNTINDGNIRFYSIDKNKSSLLFYLKFSCLLMYNLLKSNAGIFFAEDIYTLPFVCIAAKLKKGKVFYDSRELFGFLAGLKDRKNIQKILTAIEKYFIKKADYVIVTGDMDGEFLSTQYGISNIITIRNLPFYRTDIKAVNLHERYAIPSDIKILLYQGVILHGRGLRYIFNYLKKSAGSVLIILGDGEHKEYYEELAADIGIKDKVIFAGKIPQDELLNYSAGSDLGLSLIENLSISYYYALPNKLFEYIMMGLPVAISKLPQMEKVINDYNVGIVIDLDNEDEINNKLTGLLQNPELLKQYNINCLAAAKELNWDKEIEKLFTKFNKNMRRLIK